MNVRAMLRVLRGESRGLGVRWLFVVLSLAVGVAAVVAVAALSSAVRQSIRDQARELLAADLVVSARRPLPAGLDRVLASVPGLERGDARELVTVVAAEGSGRSLLVELKAVDGTYPLVGTVRVEPARPLAELLGADGVVAAPEALAQLGLSPGETVRLGGASFTVRGVVVDEPDRAVGPFSLGPRVFLSLQGLERTELIQLGSRVSYRTMVRLDGQVQADELRQRLLAELPDVTYLRIETATDAQPMVRSGIRRVERFLGLVALLSLLIGGIGVAQAVRAWLTTRLDAIAVLRCLGLRGREVLAVYLGQTALLGLVGSALGAAAGLALQWLAPLILGDALPPTEIRLWQPLPVLRGLGLGVGVALVFSLPLLLTSRRVPPVRVLRRDVEPLRASRLTRSWMAALVVAGLLGLAMVQAGGSRIAVLFTAGVVVTTVLLVGSALGLVRAIGHVPRLRAGLWLRHGLAAVARPGADTAGAIVAVGLGALVVLAMALVERRLSDQLDSELPESAPSAFFVDVQPAQWPQLEELLRSESATDIDAVPVVMARLRSVDGVAVGDLVSTTDEHRRERWALTREQRLTVLEELPEDNELVAGSLWSDPERDEVSVEVDFARSIGASVGSVLTLDVQGMPLELVVTSLRRVEWRTFRINFFLAVEPGVLDNAPQWRLAAARVPQEREHAVQDRVAALLPNVTTVPIREVLEKVSNIMGRLGLGVRLLGAFTVLAGIAILGGAASASAARRGREVALLKTLGFTRLGVVTVVAVEYGLVGLVAGVIGAVGGVALAWAMAVHGMDLPWRFEVLPVAATALGAGALTVVAGLVACARSLRQRPLEALRGE